MIAPPHQTSSTGVRWSVVALSAHPHTQHLRVFDVLVLSLVCSVLLVTACDVVTSFLCGCLLLSSSHALSSSSGKVWPLDDQCDDDTLSQERSTISRSDERYIYNHMEMRYYPQSRSNSSASFSSEGDLTEEQPWYTEENPNMSTSLWPSAATNGRPSYHPNHTQSFNYYHAPSPPHHAHDHTYETPNLPSGDPRTFSYAEQQILSHQRLERFFSQSSNEDSSSLQSYDSASVSPYGPSPNHHPHVQGRYRRVSSPPLEGYGMGPRLDHLALPLAGDKPHSDSERSSLAVSEPH